MILGMTLNIYQKKKKSYISIYTELQKDPRQNVNV
jgi:hypothetical protein